jgi:hypothetical protein
MFWIPIGEALFLNSFVCFSVVAMGRHSVMDFEQLRFLPANFRHLNRNVTRIRQLGIAWKMSIQIKRRF